MKKVSELDLPTSESNRGYDSEVIIQSFWLSVWTGASRYIHFVWLRYNTVLQRIFGLRQIRNIYNSRVDCKNRIKELKADFGLDSFCMIDFWAAEASFRFIMVAYNLIESFKFAALQSRQFGTLRALEY